MTIPSARVYSLLFAMIPVPLADLLAVHADPLSHLDALLDVPLVWVQDKLLKKQLHLSAILALPTAFKRVL